MTELRVEAHRLGWTAQSLYANERKIHRDYMARGSVLIVVEYDARGRIVEVQRREQGRGRVARPYEGGPQIILTAADSGKREQVLSWLKQPTTK